MPVVEHSSTTFLAHFSLTAMRWARQETAMPCSHRIPQSAEEGFLNWEKTCTERTRARTSSVPMRVMAWVGLETLKRAPMKAEFASCRILAVIPASLAMMSAIFFRETSSDWSSDWSSWYRAGGLGMDLRLRTSARMLEFFKRSRITKAWASRDLRSWGSQGLETYW